jgi:hypothetical protein
MTMSGQAQFELALGRTDLPLGKTAISPGSITVEGLAEGRDFTVDASASSITIAPHVTVPFIVVQFEHDQPPVPMPPPLNVGTDAPDMSDRPLIETWIADTNAYLGTASPSAGETVAQVKRNARAIKAIVKRLLG